ncbi:CatB-related O-acetyltransferase [Methylobacterium planeticum]|uniref:CatB-related O-acetyltransferase n=1 Tax=Methylobacterium planeticum TaxID=2615211 RepID=A0A6N6MNN5_9HYPH|nr:CatB-related O-acetyltransferase [Methylobacterium planeticum]KAB1070028.1 CatB-related O-acetyltransferase [Methylobacterium planeticum]
MRNAYAAAIVPITREAFAAAGFAFRHTIGEYTYGMPEVRWWGEDAGLEIGRYCSIAGNVTIMLGGNHRVDWVTTFPFSVLDPKAAHISGHPATNGGVRIGNDVWLGESCRILSGVTIGDGACIAANALVVDDVPPYAIVGGVPARVIKMRFSPEQISALREIAWWNWSPERIRAAYDELLSSDIDAFIALAHRVGAEATVWR